MHFEECSRVPLIRKKMRVCSSVANEGFLLPDSLGTDQRMETRQCVYC